MQYRIFIPLILAFLGIFLLGKGITGFVIGQSCCFPPDCSQENLCDAAKLPDNNSYFTYLGAILLFVSIILYAIFYHKKH